MFLRRATARLGWPTLKTTNHAVVPWTRRTLSGSKRYAAPDLPFQMFSANAATALVFGGAIGGSILIGSALHGATYGSADDQVLCEEVTCTSAMPQIDAKYSIYEKCDMKIFTGNAHPELAKNIATFLDVPLNKATVSKFKNGESRVEILNSVRDCDVFVVQPTCNPCPNDYIMELVILLDAFRRAGAARVTAIIPIFGYARQDRKDKSRAPISAKVIADVLFTAGVDRVLTIDLHAPQIQGFVNFPIDNLFGEPLIKKYISEALQDIDPKNIVVVSPDAGGAKRADALAKELRAGLAIMSKKRDKPGVVARMTLVGDVENKTCIIVDDMVDTAGTLTRAASELMKAGAKEVYASAVHGVLSDPAIQRINDSPIKEFIVTDTIPMDENKSQCPKMRVISVAPLLAEAVRRIHTGGSLSNLFQNAPTKEHAEWSLD